MVKGHSKSERGNPLPQPGLLFPLFNDALNIFCLRLYGVRHNMVTGHSNSERGNPLPQHGLLFPLSSKGSFVCIIPQTGYHIPRPLKREIAQWVHHEGSIRRPIAPWANALLESNTKNAHNTTHNHLATSTHHHRWDTTSTKKTKSPSFFFILYFPPFFFLFLFPPTFFLLGDPSQTKN